ncbi:MAG: hypothetical protein QNJ60_16460 [Xenococcaceae cyanobacterium MO_188.B19]|nr:hypothetical protein [Xenococcaceae cyanobacterium MO_188.B19]
MPILSDDYRDWSLVTTVIKDLSRSKIVNLGRRFESQFLLVRVSSKAQKDTWNFGGRIWATSLVLAKQAKFYQVDLDLFEQELIVVPRYFDGKYSLLYQAPNYFPDVILKVWEYRGTVTDDNNNGNVTVDLSSIEQKLNQLQLSLDELKASCFSEPEIVSPIPFISLGIL